MQHYFALDMPALRFARNTFVASLLGLLPLLVLYIALTPGLTSQLMGGGPALGLFLRQVRAIVESGVQAIIMRRLDFGLMA